MKCVISNSILVVTKRTRLKEEEVCSAFYYNATLEGGDPRSKFWRSIFYPGINVNFPAFNFTIHRSMENLIGWRTIL